MPDLRKLYLSAWAPSAPGFTEDLYCVAMADDGTTLGAHVCSEKGWMRHDLHDAPRRRAVAEEHFGGKEGEVYEVVDLGTERPPADVLAANERLHMEEMERDAR